MKLKFKFRRNIEGVEINTSLRVSIWLEDSNNNYLMPCEFKEAEALKINNKYLIKVDALDPDEFITTKHIGKRFNFGHPGKIIGSGILISIDN